MRVTRNTKFIRRRGLLGTFTSLAGVAVLTVGMVASISRPDLIWVSFISLIVGFILAQMGTHNLRRWGRTPRPDQIIEEQMKGFDDRYHYYAWSLNAPYVLLSPHGVYSFVTRDQTGQVSVLGSKWKRKAGIRGVLMAFAQEGLGNPSMEAMDTATRLQDWISAKLPEVTVKVRPAVVFIDPKVDLQVQDPAVPVQEAGDLKKWLRGAGKGEAIRHADMKSLEALFDSTAAAAINK